MPVTLAGEVQQNSSSLLNATLLRTPDTYDDQLIIKFVPSPIVVTDYSSAVTTIMLMLAQRTRLDPSTLRIMLDVSGPDV